MSVCAGLTVAAATLAQYNAQFAVAILGGSNARTAVSADGGNIRDRTTGNTSQNISQEVVQEFQLSSVNWHRHHQHGRGEHRDSQRGERFSRRRLLLFSR
ncbi:MAG: hypothetical protein HY235_03285 [Acidobacteria bacterium]|nr:hypothetical protein [Acidobacteriota bacterium]